MAEATLPRCEVRSMRPRRRSEVALGGILGSGWEEQTVGL